MVFDSSSAPLTSNTSSVMANWELGCTGSQSTVPEALLLPMATKLHLISVVLKLESDGETCCPPSIPKIVAVESQDLMLTLCQMAPHA